MIEIKNLQKVFDNKFEALKSINLQIEEGDLVCLLGPSGCGKTTILNLIAGLLDPTNGDIKFDGKSVVDLHPKDRGIGLVFQNYALYPHMTVLENIMFPLTVGKNKIAKSEAIKIARKYMKITSIEELEEKKPGQMSGGQQQRVAITRALVQNPKVLLLDEPLSNLDARLRLKIREEIRLLVKELGITTIFVTHDQEEALSISDKIVIMDKGVVQQYDKPYNLYLDPVNLFVAKFMGNPVINIYEFIKQGNSLVSRDFSIALNELDNSKLKEELIDEQKYIVGIRPEYFSISENPLLNVNVKSIELIGKDCIVNFMLNDVFSKTITDVANRVEQGDNIGLGLDTKEIYIFTEDGKRVY
ncbi:ABC transporter ATP-binding protein [Helcococcus ovis]|uniref:ABC transporter ATP-binding protein n=3 Tax=Helcococcus ovis TaxID=72026 RepID=A0A4R9C0J4_9FIRM|nr:ABC transporter ATP-binding protein [Helcococcus ovis]TFF64571.1 ABC transporter ATP-binding protein [Helcococcus ovis]TFF65381.1 ABC transporter ATP-binding protein [Helcococcus ovis]TFF68437.1 ABC transporter ATP-binding protein [Helcococcus ovis]WNZ00493.1 ABC transporter ATP-binding protein [Helcococcus ovis]